MAKRTYRVSVVADVDIEVDDSILDTALGADWKSTFYDLQTRNRVVEFLTYNMAIRQSSLSRIDGFADQSDELVIVKPIDWEIDCEGELEASHATP